MKFTIGVEEEFFLVDPATRDLISQPTEAIFEACERNAGPHRIVHEFLNTQIETNTKVCTSIGELRGALLETRRIVLNAANEHGAAVIAASMHPFAKWQEQSPTPKERYEEFELRMQDAVRRILVSGMHIHVGFGDEDQRIRVMSTIRHYMPVFCVLSASSPIVEGRQTGFRSFRLNYLSGLPRTGIPPYLSSWSDYQNVIDELESLEFINDGTELWWDIRPSAKYPTIELRICDTCSLVDDAVALAALYVCLIHHLQTLDETGKLPSHQSHQLIEENRWHAQRYGILAFFADPTVNERRIVGEIVEELLDTLKTSAQICECEAELASIGSILARGTSADRQFDTMKLAELDGASEKESLRNVVDMLIAETKVGVGE
ncbi:MAG: carboxylate-amine ligase [Gammaproteobacteria bacterium]|nr:carboxylate-amine ligase [Gammaproteobacteria bacterium]